ncbi:MAG: DUF2079 domain-containing protein [Ruminococcus sp.]|nr:DUF2079 domain-containing protein [Ruminococcus sp.]
MIKYIDKIKSFYLNEKVQKYFSADRLFACFISSFLFATIFQMFMCSDFTDLKLYYANTNQTTFIAVIILSYFAQIAATYFLRKTVIIPYCLLASTIILSMQFAISFTDNGVFFLLGIAFVDFVVLKWLVDDDKLKINNFNISYKACFIIACVLCVAATVAMGYFTSLRYTSFRNTTFDFGIFAQMFEGMKNTFTPITTVERNELLSHFGVHFSPIFYLLLPGYLIFQSPLYLFYAQSFVIAVGVIAVFLICRKLQLSGKLTLAFMLIYISYPCLFNASFYDFHENKILTSLILFLFYFIISNNIWGTVGFSVLTLMVKEDAAIYVIFIALYMILARKEYSRGFLLISLSVAYFIIANIIVRASGEEGVMMWRLSDYFVDGEESYLSVFKGIFYDIGHLVKMIFTVEKLPFVIWMLLPVAFTPLMNKKLSTLVLLAPMIPINLMQEWQYQYNIDYQYSYGVAALILFATIVTIKELKSDKKRFVVLFSVVCSLVMFCNITVPKINTNISSTNESKRVCELTEKVLEKIPTDASVIASQCFVPHLYKVSELYSVPDYYNKLTQTDYIVFDTRYMTNEEYDLNWLMGDNYTQIDQGGYAVLYKKNS